MKRFPDLTRIRISIPNDEIQVQAIVISSIRHLDILSYNHSLSFECLQKFTGASFESSLIALIYELPEVDCSGGNLHKLESLLKGEDQNYRIGIFHEPASNYSDIYLLGHKNDTTGLGPFIKNARIGIFHFNYENLFGMNIENYNMYINFQSLSNSESSKHFKQMIANKKLITSNIDTISAGISKFSQKNNRIHVKLVTAKKIIRKLAKKFNRDEKDNDFQCIYCKNSKKNILFLPCCHIVMCKECLTVVMQIQINVCIKNYKFECVRCNKKVKQAKEVFY